jgi:hypothetical protein
MIWPPTLQKDQSQPLVISCSCAVDDKAGESLTGARLGGKALNRLGHAIGVKPDFLAVASVGVADGPVKNREPGARPKWIGAPEADRLEPAADEWSAVTAGECGAGNTRNAWAQNDVAAVKFRLRGCMWIGELSCELEKATANQYTVH